MINSAAPAKHRDGVLLGDVSTTSEIVGMYDISAPTAFPLIPNVTELGN